MHQREVIILRLFVIVRMRYHLIHNELLNVLDLALIVETSNHGLNAARYAVRRGQHPVLLYQRAAAEMAAVAPLKGNNKREFSLNGLHAADYLGVSSRLRYRWCGYLRGLHIGFCKPV